MMICRKASVKAWKQWRETVPSMRGISSKPLRRVWKAPIANAASSMTVMMDHTLLLLLLWWDTASPKLRLQHLQVHVCGVKGPPGTYCKVYRFHMKSHFHLIAGSPNLEAVSIIGHIRSCPYQLNCHSCGTNSSSSTQSCRTRSRSSWFFYMQVRVHREYSFSGKKIRLCRSIMEIWDIPFENIWQSNNQSLLI